MTMMSWYPVQGIFPPLDHHDPDQNKCLLKVSEVAFPLQSAIVGQEDKLKSN